MFGPLLAPYDPTLPNLSLAWVGPVGGHVLGFDFEGRDVASRLLAGAQSSMLGPLAVVMISVPVGTLIAVTAAWRRRAADVVISSGLDILFAFPGILLALLATAVFGAGLPAATIALSVAYLPYVARVLRGAALTERSQPYVAALEVQGAPATAICLRHLVPNIAPLILAQATSPVRLRHGRPGGHLVPGPGSTAAHRQLGRDDLRKPGRYRSRATRCPRSPPGCASWPW